MTPGIQELMRALEKTWDDHVRAVRVDRDVDAAMALCAPETSLVNLPVMSGGRDAAAVRRYLTEDLLPHLPGDLATRRISRTVDRFRVVDEEIVSFTHDRALPWLLPGVDPTGRHAEVMAITVATVRQGRIVSQRVLWDHAGLAARLGPGTATGVTGGLPDGLDGGPAGWW